MAARSNAVSELTRFWLEARHGCLVQESIPVPVPYGQSDIDFLAMHPRSNVMQLPSGISIGSRLIVETKGEHDFDPKGKEFGKYIRQDLEKLGMGGWIPVGTKDVKFTMLREQHFAMAHSIFGSDDFDRLFVLHAIDYATLAEVAPRLSSHRIYVMPIKDLVADLTEWYRAHPRPAGLRHTLTGDLWHLLVGFCGMRLPE